MKQMNNSDKTGMNKTSVLAGWYVFCAITAITKTYQEDIF